MIFHVKLVHKELGVSEEVWLLVEGILLRMAGVVIDDNRRRFLPILREKTEEKSR